MTPNSKYGEQLFKLLPELYQFEDSKIAPLAYPLKRYLSVLGSGMDDLSSGIDDYRYLRDIDKCPDHLLDIACNFYDFKFPANTTPETKRRMLKVFPKLYQHKGTRQAFIYLTRAMFGVTSEIEVYTKSYEEGMDVQELRKIFLKVQIDDTVVDINNKMNNFEVYAEIIRPVNRLFVVTLSTIFNEEIQSGWVVEDKDVTKINDFYFVDDSFTKLNKFVSNKDKTTALGFHYNLINRDGTGVKFSDIIRLALEEESINVTKYITKPSKTNKDRLNTTFMLSASNITVDKLKDFTDYSIDLNVREEAVTSLHYLESTNNIFRANVSKTNIDELTSSTSHISLSVLEDEDLKPKSLNSESLTFNKPKDSYSSLNKSKLNGGLVLTHKKHYDIIKINGVIQQII